MPDSAYLQLKEKYNQLFLLKTSASLLRWDASTYMPKFGSEMRAKQIALMEEYQREIFASKNFAALINTAQQEKLGLENLQNFNLIVKAYRKKLCVPNALEEKIICLSYRTEQLWEQAREENNYTLVSSSFAELIKYVREKADILANEFKISAYTALIYEYDEAFSEKDFDSIFTGIISTVPGKIKSAQLSHDTNKLPELAAHPDRQRVFIKNLLQYLAFDFSSGRVDETIHPFCEGYAQDIRIAITYDPDNWTSAYTALMHELGHATYDKNLPKDWQGQPLGEDAGMCMHESQSLLFEMHIARSTAFLDYIRPLIINDLGFEEFDVENLSKHMQKINLTPIRIKSDFQTYPLHIALRYQIEKELIDGSLKVNDLPEYWSALFQDLFFYKPKNLKEGCLQDIHWFMGSFGYFPTYAVGALMSNIFYKVLQKNIPSVNNQFSSETFLEICSWLKLNLHQQAHRYSAKDLLKQSTGMEIN